MLDILNLRTAYRPQDMADFDLQLGPHFRLYNLAIRKSQNGNTILVCPKAYGTNACTFAPPLASEICELVLAQIEGEKPHAESAA